MADAKISALTDGSPVVASDQIPVNRGGANCRVSVTAALAALSAVTPAADKLPYFTSTTTAGVTDLTSGARAALGIATDGTSASAIGYQGIPQNSQSAAYGIVASDNGKHIYHPGADTTARTWTLPANGTLALPIGFTVTFVNDTSGGVITIAITSDTLVLAGAGTTGSRTLAANGIATAVKITATRWIISGSGLT